MLTDILIKILAWAFVGAIILGALYWIGVILVCIYRDIKGTPFTRKGTGDVLKSDRSHKTYHVRIDITSEEPEDNDNKE